MPLLELDILLTPASREATFSGIALHLATRKPSATNTLNWKRRFARCLAFRDVSTAVAALLSFVRALIGVRWRRQWLALRLAAAR